MSGYVLPVIPKRVLDFASLAIGGTQDVVLADRVELLHWRELTLRVQVHTHSLISGAGGISIFVQPQSWTDQDPGLAFLDTSVTLGFVNLSSATPNPAFLSNTVPTLGAFVIAGMGRVIGRGQRSNPGAMSASVSVQFSSKDA